jgi:hypothetical protein
MEPASSCPSFTVVLAVNDEDRDAHVGPAAALGVNGLGVDGEAVVHARRPLLLVVVGGEPARLLPGLPRRRAEAHAPPLDESERGRQEHEGADARVLLGDACSGEPAQARPDEHGAIGLAADGRARGRDHRREAEVLERRHAQVEPVDGDAAHVVVVADGEALVRAGAGRESVEVEEAGARDDVGREDRILHAVMRAAAARRRQAPGGRVTAI